MLTVVVSCACVAIGCGVYLLSGGTETQLVLAIVAIILGVALVAVAIALYLQSNTVSRYLQQFRNDMRSADRGYREAQSRSEYLAQQVLDLRNRGEQINSAIMSGFSELKAGYGSLSEQMRDLSRQNTGFGLNGGGFGSAFAQSGFAQTRHAPQSETEKKPFPHSVFKTPTSEAAPFVKPFKPVQQPANVHTPDARPEAIAPRAGVLDEQHEDYAFADASTYQPGSFADRLSTSLEPVIDLFTSKTTHYRLHLGMLREDGEEVPSDTVLHHADRTGLRAGFDLHASREALLLLRRLRQRDAGLSIFLPVGAQTLQSEDTIARVMNLLVEYHDVASGLVLEIPHAMLAGLSDLGLEGLAKLARAGHTLALSNVSTAGVDLPALSKLNVRYVSLNVSHAAGADGPSKQMLQFAQTARSLRVHIIVTNVSDQRTVANISKITRFAAGPCFAEPRRVRADVTSTQPTSYSNVA